MSEASEIPHSRMDPRKLSRKKRKLYYRYSAGRLDGAFSRGRVVAKPRKLMTDTFGEGYIAHLKAGEITVVVRVVNDAQWPYRFMFTHATRHYRREKGVQKKHGFLPVREGPVRCQGRVGAIRFLKRYAEDCGITFNKICYAKAE